MKPLTVERTLKISPEQRPAVVASILHHLMYPYFLTRTPEMQEKFGERQYQAFMQALADYCMRGYVENPEPRLTIDFIQGLHRQFYSNTPSAPVKTMDGSMMSMVPGEFKTTRVLIRRHNMPGEWFDTTAPEDVTRDMERLLELLHDERIPLFQRYSRFILDFGCIHPFPDGNGKTYMLLGDLFLLKQGIQPPYYAKYKRENEALVYGRYDDYFLDSQRDVSIFYPLLVEAYAGCGLALPATALPATDLPAQALDRLLAETRAAIAAGDLPVGCVLTVGDTLLSSHRNTVRSQEGRRFHAERNLLERLDGADLPAGRRVLWVTLEPCLRCAQAIQRFGVDEVVYVLDDPFRGGKALLDQAGITVTRRGEWERDYLGRVMDFYARYPEFCAVRQFGHALTAWQRHQPLGRDEQVKAAFLHHLAPYLPNVPEARQEEVRRAFLAHVDALVRLTLEECHRVPSPTFVGNLHRALFPPGYRHCAVGNDGVASETGSGEWRRHVVGRNYTEFSTPEVIEADLSALLNRLSAKALLQREDALQFLLEFLAVFPFTDGNGRVAAILADVICLNHGLAPLAVDIKNPLFKTALWEDVRADAPVENQLRLVDGWNRGQVDIRPRSIYDDWPSAFQTYARRLGDKRHVVEHIMAKLAGRQLGQHFVVTDIGAGTGEIADGLLDGLFQREGITLEYHYLEPSQTYVGYYRAHSRHAASPQVIFHTLPVEDYLLPLSDLIVVSQALQYIPRFGETLRDIVSALKPGGIALVVVTRPEGDEFEMVNRLTLMNGIYPLAKRFLDEQGIAYEETLVETPVRIGPEDRDTPEGDDLLTFYFRQPAHVLQPSVKEAFWNGVAEFAEDGGVKKMEAFFWLRRGKDEGDFVQNTLSPETRHAGENRILPGVVSMAEPSSAPLTFDEAIEASLLPRLLHTLNISPEQEHERLISHFNAHLRLLSEYLRGEIIDGKLSIGTAIGFHVRLYPPGHMILETNQEGKAVYVSPGAWRQREIRDGYIKNVRWFSVCSPFSCIERDLENVITALNEIQNPRREDILRFYFLFLKVHPFADSNGTTAAVLADALCARHGFAPLLPLNIRFKDKVFHWSLFEAFEMDRSEQALTNLLGKFDAFNRLFQIQGLPALLSTQCPIS